MVCYGNKKLISNWGWSYLWHILLASRLNNNFRVKKKKENEKRVKGKKDNKNVCFSFNFFFFEKLQS